MPTKPKPPPDPVRIIIDTREQAPWSFTHCAGAETVRAKLDTGDYSVSGLETRVAIERKSLNDLIGCLAYYRGRFERELARGRELDMFAVIVEAEYREVIAGLYRSNLSPKAAVASLAAFHVRYGVPFLFCGGRRDCATAAFQLLRFAGKILGEGGTDANMEGPA